MTQRQILLILDFGSQYNQLIARRVREAGVYSEIHPYTLSLDAIRRMAPAGIILSGGPDSVNTQNAPRLDPAVFELGIPMLAICYGMQLIAHQMGGAVSRGLRAEYGRTRFQGAPDCPLFAGLPDHFTVWMSHGDQVLQLPEGFLPSGRSDNTEMAAMSDPERRIYGLQFHPEVTHTEYGALILRNFLTTVCRVSPDWSMAAFIDTAIQNIRDTVGTDRVILGLSGGVDSSVVAALLHRAIGDQLTCVFVDNGLLRKNERGKVERLFRNHFGIRLIVVDAEREFLTALQGITDPETKRKTIGRVFIEVFDREAGANQDYQYLAQGTLYPDVIESVSAKGGPTATIKSHHNVGGLPDKMNLKLLEPLRELFKDEVRELGRLLGLPDELVDRHPFPGPGLAVRLLGAITAEQLDVLREADAIVIEEVKLAGWYLKLWQSFAVLLPLKTVGVMGDSRTYENIIAVRAVESVDGMTADWAKLPYDLMGRISSRIINEVRGVNRVVLDISSKPPATIEWE